MSSGIGSEWSSGMPESTDIAVFSVSPVLVSLIVLPLPFILPRKNQPGTDNFPSPIPRPYPPLPRRPARGGVEGEWRGVEVEWKWSGGQMI